LLQDDLQTARDLLARAQIEGQHGGSSAALACVDRALGRLHLVDGASARAIDHLEQALERAGDAWGPDQRAETLYWLGTAYLELNRAQHATQCLEQAVELVKKTNLPGLLAGPAAEAPRLLQSGRKLGVDPLVLGEVERLAATRRPWTGIRARPRLEVAVQNELPRVEVQLFGSFVLHRNGQLIEKASRKIDRAGELAALLILHPNGLSDEAIAEMMFPDKAGEGAQHNLQMAVYGLRKDLGSKVAVRYGAHMYQLSPELELVADVRQFDAALAAARGATGGALIQSLSKAVELYKGPLLADAAWSWLEPVRLEYRQRYVSAALQLADALAPADLPRSDRLAEDVLAVAPETDLAYERLILNAKTRRDTHAVRRLRNRYEQAAALFDFVINPYLTDAGSSGPRFAR
jgi:DNA-binding SARP family transcriptional activator